VEAYRQIVVTRERKDFRSRNGHNSSTLRLLMNRTAMLMNANNDDLALEPERETDQNGNSGYPHNSRHRCLILAKHAKGSPVFLDIFKRNMEMPEARRGREDRI